jgi:hypothetical protein
MAEESRRGWAIAFVSTGLNLAVSHGLFFKVRRPLVPPLRNTDGVTEILFLDALPFHRRPSGVVTPKVRTRPCGGHARGR